MPSLETDALARKRKYAALDALIADSDLLDNVHKHETGVAEPLLTLGTTLLRDHHSPPLPAAMLMRSLDENLSIFVPPLRVDQRKALAANLLNGHNQFLNTLSELGLARYYKELGWQVSLAEQLPPGTKDVDLYIKLGGDFRWLDVLNSAPNEWEGDGFAPMLPADFELRLIDKVVQKFEAKFREAIDGGWNGSPWVALDFTKHDGIARTLTMLGLVGSKKLDGFATDVLSRCPELSGVVYFTYYASETKAYWVREFPRS